MSQRQRAHAAAVQMAAQAGRPLPKLEEFGHLSDDPDPQAPPPHMGDASKHPAQAHDDCPTCARWHEQQPAGQQGTTAPQQERLPARAALHDGPGLDALDEKTRGIVTRTVGRALAEQQLTFAATSALHEPGDVLRYVDPTTVLGADGRPDDTLVQQAIRTLADTRPHLFRVTDSRRQAASDAGQGASGTADAGSQARVDQIKAQMQAGSRW
jgi:hypothetical protein